MVARLSWCKYLVLLLGLIFHTVIFASVEAEGKELVMKVRLNGIDFPQPSVVLIDSQGILYAQQSEFDYWRLNSNNLPVVRFDGLEYIKVPVQLGGVLKIDEVNLQLEFTAEPDRFLSTTLALGKQSTLEAVSSGSGAFLNYDITASQFDGTAFQGGFFEGGVFTPYGVGTTTHFFSRSSAASSAVRLDSTWEMDLPNSLAALKLGDSITRQAPWSLSNRFAGVQFATNFRTNPSLNVLPQRAATGIATTPSTVEVYVNNVLQSRQQVAPGPFSIQDIPATTGVGDVRVVVRDVTGREQVINQNFYQSQGLLKEGQTDYSFEAGVIRKNYGRDSSDYGAALFSGTYRYGISEGITGGYHLESSPGNFVSGVGGVYTLGDLAALNVDLASSSSVVGRDGLIVVGVDRTSRTRSIGATAQKAGDKFRVLAEDGVQRVTDSSLSARAGQFFKGYGTLTGIISRATSLSQTSRSLGISYGTQLPGAMSLNVSYSRSLSQVKQDTLFLSMFLPLERSRSLSVLASKQKGSDRIASTQFRQNLPFGVGTGYSIEAGTGRSYRAEVSQNTSVGTYSASASTLQGEVASTLTASGGIATLGGGLFFSRRIDDSFGVVRVASYPDVEVRHENSLVGTTDSNGQLLVTNLRAYQENRISINPDNLPFEAEIATTEKTGIPFFRSGVLVEFPVKKTKALTLELIDASGNSIPSGAKLFDEQGDSLNTVVGTGGVVYISEPPPNKSLTAKWKGGSCRVDIVDLADRFVNESIVDLGVLKCETIH